MSRAEVIGRLADHLASLELGHPVRVGIDGPCGAGKSTLAEELAHAVRGRGRAAIHVDSDGFHNVRAVRYARGRDSALGYYEGAYDLVGIRERVLRPLGPGGSREYAVGLHDLETDAVVRETAVAPPDAVVLFGCTFVFHRDLADLWDERIWLDVPRGVAIERAAHRDAERMGGLDVALASQEARYAAAFDIYLERERPAERATIVLGQADPAQPTIERLP